MVGWFYCGPLSWKSPWFEILPCPTIVFVRSQYEGGNIDKEQLAQVPSKTQRSQAKDCGRRIYLDPNNKILIQPFTKRLSEKMPPLRGPQKKNLKTNLLYTSCVHNSKWFSINVRLNYFLFNVTTRLLLKRYQELKTRLSMYKWDSIIDDHAQTRKLSSSFAINTQVDPIKDQGG